MQTCWLRWRHEILKAGLKNQEDSTELHQGSPRNLFQSEAGRTGRTGRARRTALSRAPLHTRAFSGQKLLISRAWQVWKASALRRSGVLVHAGIRPVCTCGGGSGVSILTWGHRHRSQSGKDNSSLSKNRAPTSPWDDNFTQEVFVKTFSAWLWH